MYLRSVALFACSGLMLSAAQPAASSSPDKLFQLLRSGNAPAVRAALSGGGSSLNAKDADGATPLMYAALYGDASLMRLLIERGADVNATNAAGATALHWATGSLEKVQLLVKAGANVNTVSALGKTPLMIAASRDGAGSVVAFLLDQGAKIDNKDATKGFAAGIPMGGGGATALIEASKARDGHALALLLAKGADVNARENNGSSALLNAIALQNRSNIQTLLARGADVNAAMVTGTTPLLLAAARGDADTVEALLSRGAKIDALDGAGNSALHWAAYSDVPRPKLVRRLAEAGLAINQKNKLGDTPLAMAARRGDTPVTALLLAKGAEPEPARPAAAIIPANMGTQPDVMSAIRKSLPMLQKSGPDVFKERGCVSCHNNMLPAMVAAMARDRGQKVDEAKLEFERKALISLLKPAQEILFENGDNLPDMQVTAGYSLMALTAQGHRPDSLTDAIVHNLANKQNTDGSWTLWAPRPPMENGDIQATAVSLRALQLYAPEARKAEFDARIRRAGQWLANAEPANTEDENWRLMGLVWSKANRKTIDQAVQRVKRLQRADGGWGQMKTLPTDAYATGQSLYALRQAGFASTYDSVMRQGIDYLLRTQQADGTWQVKSRAFPFQPYFESGFPYGPDQWISAAGSSWATIALLQTQPDPRANTIAENRRAR